MQPWSFALLLGTLPGTTWAHVPHDTVASVAPAPGLDPTRPWWLFADHWEATDLYQSSDGGRTWSAQAGECLVDRLSRSATLDDGVVVVLGEGRYWTTRGDNHWASTAVDFTVNAIVGRDRLYLGAADGIWAAAPGEPLELVWSGGAVSSLGSGAVGMVATLSSGSVLVNRGAGWSELPEPPLRPHAATLDAEHVYIGDSNGGVWRLDDTSWVPCATSPLVDYNTQHPAVARLATDGTTLVMAHLDVGPVFSIDACQSWVANPAPLEIDWPDDGTPSFTGDLEAFSALAVAGEAAFVAGYDGAALWHNGVWSHSPLRGGDYPRGVAFSTRFEEDGAALVPTYGCAVARTFDRGRSWVCPGIGYTEPGSQDVDIPPDADGLVPAYALDDRIPHRSDDGGETWVRLEGDWDQVRVMEAGPNNRVWAVNIDEGDTLWFADLGVSVDRGASWAEVAGLPASAESQSAHGLIDLGTYVALFSREAVYLSTDDAVSFAEVYTATDEIWSITQWPAVDPVQLVVAQSHQINVVAGETVTQAVIPETEASLRLLTTASDGTLFAATNLERLWRSTDGGYTWTDLGAQLPAQVEALHTHPLFDRWPEVIASTSSGSFRVDADGSVRRWTGYQHQDDVTDWFTCTPDCAPVSWPGASLGVLTPLPVGATASVWIRGSTVRFLGEAAGSSSGIVRVDGAEVATWQVAKMPLGSVLVEVTGLTDTLHLVDLMVTAGDALGLDAASALSESEPLGGPGIDGEDTATTDSASSEDSVPGADPARPEGEGGCCNGSAAGVTPLVGLVALIRRRRAHLFHESAPPAGNRAPGCACAQ